MKTFEQAGITNAEQFKVLGGWSFWIGNYRRRKGRVLFLQGPFGDIRMVAMLRNPSMEALFRFMMEDYQESYANLVHHAFFRAQPPCENVAGSGPADTGTSL